MENRRKKGGKKGRRKSKEFMDAALDGYIRHLALQRWRDVSDLQEALGVDPMQAVRETGTFPERGPYQEIWRRWWQTEVVAGCVGAATPLLGCIEAAVKGALREEIAARKQQGDAPLEDSLEYRRFLDHALNRLFEEEAGSIEDL